MHPAAAVFYVLAVLAEASGIILVVQEAKGAETALRDYLDRNPEKNAGGSWGQIEYLQPVMLAALGSTGKRRLAVILLIIGVAAGSLGNFLTL